MDSIVSRRPGISVQQRMTTTTITTENDNNNNNDVGFCCVHSVDVCRVRGSGCHCHLCISVIDRRHPTTARRRRRRRWQTANVKASIGDMTDALDVLTHCIILVQVVVVFGHTRGCWASWPSSSSSTTTTKRRSMLFSVVVGGRRRRLVGWCTHAIDEAKHDDGMVVNVSSSSWWYRHHHKGTNGRHALGDDREPKDHCRRP